MTDLALELWTDYIGQDIAEYAVMLAVILVLVVGLCAPLRDRHDYRSGSVRSAIGSQRKHAIHRDVWCPGCEAPLA